MTKDKGKKECTFPMIYKGKNFGNKCITEGHHSLWCYTDGSYGHCPDTDVCTGKTKGVSRPIYVQLMRRADLLDCAVPS